MKSPALLKIFNIFKKINFILKSEIQLPRWTSRHHFLQKLSFGHGTPLASVKLVHEACSFFVGDEVSSRLNELLQLVLCHFSILVDVAHLECIDEAEQRVVIESLPQVFRHVFNSEMSSDQLLEFH